jgi:hypothetical protein
MPHRGRGRVSLLFELWCAVNADGGKLGTKRREIVTVELVMLILKRSCRMAI